MDLRKLGLSLAVSISLAVPANAAEPQADTKGCDDTCFIADTMHLTGSIASGALDFELEGSVLGKGAFDVPLFGPPQRVRIDDARINGQKALIGFTKDHYYVRTAERHFVLRGKIALPELGSS